MSDDYFEIEQLINDIQSYANSLHENKEAAKKNHQGMRTEGIKTMYRELKFTMSKLEKYMK